MTFPKKFMKVSEITALGFPRETLDRIYNEKGQTIAFKMNPEKKNSHIVFDTEGLIKRMEQEIRFERSMRS